MNQLLIAIILSILPVTELRAGLPFAINYALKNNLAVFPIFLLVVFVNIAVIFFIFFFLDFLNERLLKIRLYSQFFNFYLRRTRKRVDKFEKNYADYGFLALAVFVAIPFPVTGAWTGSLIAWLLDLDRKRSILAISLGVFIAGVLVLLASLGAINLIRII